MDVAQPDTRRRVKDLVNAFAANPALPKMLRTLDIYDTLADGCAKGAFVLQLTRPDRTVRTWWFVRPDEAMMKDRDLELVLAEAAVLRLPPAPINVLELLPAALTADRNPDDGAFFDCHTGLCRRLLGSPGGHLARLFRPFGLTKGPRRRVRFDIGSASTSRFPRSAPIGLKPDSSSAARCRGNREITRFFICFPDILISLCRS